MELYIETLTGAAFELRVSPFETIMSVKAKIQRLEGIPIAQQHLIWKSEELEDEYCLHDYHIHDGATLKLVLAMRGGPINTRRIPMEDPALREMAEYVEANRDEILEKLPGNRQVTLVVFREGDQLSFFRVVDRGDGTLTPLSESLRTSRLRHLPASTSYSLSPSATLNRNLCLPPVGHSIGHVGHSSLALRHSLVKERMERIDHQEEKEKASAAFESSLQAVAGASKLASDSDDSDSPSYEELSSAAAQQLDSLERLSKVLSRVMDGNSSKQDSKDDFEEIQDISQDINTDSSSASPLDKPIADYNGLKEPGENIVGRSESSDCDKIASCAPASVKQELLDMGKLVNEATPGPSRPVTSVKKESSHNFNDTMRVTHSSRAKSKVKDYSLFDSLRDTLGASSSMSRHSSLDKRKEFTLESLTTSEARAMSGLLRQASLEKVGSSRIGNVTVTSASRNRVTGNYMLGNSTFNEGRITTPDGRLLSARLQRMTASRDGRILSPTHRLPPVKAKKKASKRCGNNFCASHRYAESHDCTFDYKTEGRKLLEQANPVVSAPKLPKI
ncbi:ZFAN4-like protein [Mya arenaria]|uniref:ZFAN4-like protein n=1 Tax=Mya arenaria TaxID=6604 RepID=A0ABY7DKG2_MYAAR|nr:ZFAN4-like protein [Mya arenaria]